MNRREQLQDQYEDSLFALLMDEIATIEGKKAEEENERLLNDSSAEIPEDLERRCMQIIKQHYAKQKAYTAGRFALKTMKRVAMAAGIAAILFTTAFATSETVRVNTLNLMIEVFETNTEFRFSSSSLETVSELGVGWLPDGYILTGQGCDDIETWYDYQKSESEFLSISCKKTDGLVAGIDTENAETEKVKINGNQAILIKKGEEIQLFWTTKDNSLLFSVMGCGINQGEIIHIANELHF